MSDDLTIDPVLRQVLDTALVPGTDRSTLLDRLRGRYPIGPRLSNGQPEFGYREFPAAPIGREAADEIERLTRENAELRESLGHLVAPDCTEDTCPRCEHAESLVLPGGAR